MKPALCVQYTQGGFIIASTYKNLRACYSAEVVLFTYYPYWACRE